MMLIRLFSKSPNLLQIDKLGDFGKSLCRELGKKVSGIA
jgi:hypothetical protein